MQYLKMPSKSLGLAVMTGDTLCYYNSRDPDHLKPLHEILDVSREDLQFDGKLVRMGRFVQKYCGNYIFSVTHAEDFGCYMYAFVDITDLSQLHAWERTTVTGMFDYSLRGERFEANQTLKDKFGVTCFADIGKLINERDEKARFAADVSKLMDKPKG